ncbi:hypothetical protein GS399_00890 [Pedobacter sp. HMF7647]|uniref:Uncharacterized protein n=1 Tax=Hufsiella arboris TaxID=2695275 RepID=A0A7K1Y4K8_9SPHI|nr:hypothetical protein [Hufsiella arboris]MXV49512.1 hypothetical protein [Hufsiella arboris]
MNTGIVCILDALATKGVWSIDEPATYLQKLKRVHNSIFDVKNYVINQGYPFIVDYLTFSDTIIITLQWNKFEDETLIPYVVRLIDGVLSTCLAENLLMRGALSFGKFIKEDNIIIGPAIDDAAYWHDKAQLIGCVLTPNTTLLYDSGIEYIEKNHHEDHDYRQHAIKYKTPFKNNTIYDLYNVNWPLSTYKAFKPLGDPAPLIRVKSILGRYPIPAEAYNKHENTISFFNYCIEQISNEEVG